MKIVRMPASLIAAPLALLLACHQEAEKPEDGGTTQKVVEAPERQAKPAISEKEPNDTTSQAQPISATAVIEGRLEPAASRKKFAIDWYRIEPAGGTEWLLRVSVSPSGEKDLSLLFLDADRNRLLSVDSMPAGQGEEYPNLVFEKAVYLAVRSKSTDAETPYRLEIELKHPEPGWETECNDRWSIADQLAIGGGIKGYLGRKRDADWYKVSLEGLDPNLVLRAELSAVEGVRFELVVTDEQERRPLVVRRGGSKGKPVRVRNLGLSGPPEAVYVVVRSAWVKGEKKGKFVRTFNPSVPYSLVVSVESAAADLELESNDEPARAMPLKDGQVVRGFVAVPSDKDWYAVELEQPSILSATLEVPERLDLQLYVLDTASVEAAKAGKKDSYLVRRNAGRLGEPEQVVNVALPKGKNYLRVEGAWKLVDGRYVRDFASAEETYRLSVNLGPDDGRTEREPNDREKEASAVEVGKPVRGTIHPAGDVDWFVLDLSADAGPSNVLVELSPLPKLDLGFALYEQQAGAEPKLLAKVSKAPASEKEYLMKELVPGVYLIKVWGSPRTESNATDSYTLSVSRPG